MLTLFRNAHPDARASDHPRLNRKVIILEVTSSMYHTCPEASSRLKRIGHLPGHIGNPVV